MARKQVLVQLDDSLVAGLDEVAKLFGVSRSEILRRSAYRYLESMTEEEADRRSIDSYKRFPEDPADNEVFARLAAETMTEW